ATDGNMPLSSSSRVRLGSCSTRRGSHRCRPGSRAVADRNRPWPVGGSLGTVKGRSDLTLLEGNADMLSRRSMLSATGAAGIGLTATACGSPEGGSTADGPVDLAADAADLSGEITLLTPDFVGDARPKLDDMIEHFTSQNPDVTVKVDQVAWDKLNEKLSTSIAGGLVAD